jgi:hypothetical protein
MSRGNWSAASSASRICNISRVEPQPKRSNPFALEQK